MPHKKILKFSAAGCAALAATVLAAAPAAAHPHVWVTVETTINYDNGTVTGFTHKWTFDEMYAAMAILESRMTRWAQRSGFGQH